jgi:hypothetical protein
MRKKKTAKMGYHIQDSRMLRVLVTLDLLFWGVYDIKLDLNSNYWQLGLQPIS